MLEINKIYQGDCLEVMKQIDDKSVDMIITDPPYGVLPNGKIFGNGKKDNFTWDNIELESFSKKWYNECKRIVKNNSFIFVFWSQKYLNIGINIFNPERIIFWRYNNLINNPTGDFCYDYEPIFVIKIGKPKLIKGKHSCDLEFTKPQSNFIKDKLIHPTQKPLKLIEHIISLTSEKIILDLFIGSGTTAVACINTNRNFIGIELDENYCKIAEARIEKAKQELKDGRL